LLIMEDDSQLQYKITVPDPNGNRKPKDPNAVEQAPNIRLDLYFVQLSDNYNHSIGLRWPDSIGGGASSLGQYRFQFGSTSGVSNSSHQLQLTSGSALPRLDLAQAKGWARLYRQVALITANGFSSKFSNGGEVNVAVAGQVTGQIQTIRFGTTLTCTPRYDEESGRIELKVSANVSDLTAAGATGIPGRILSEISTVVNLEMGEAVVLGGFLSRSEAKSRTGIPGLSQIPILGALFGTHASRSDESEGLMFIVPSVVDAVPLRKRNRIQEALRVYEDFSGGIDDVDLLEQPRISR